MGSIDMVRNELKQYLLHWFGANTPINPEIALEITVLLWIVLFAIILHLFLHGFVGRLLRQAAKKQENKWHRALANKNLLSRVWFVLQGAVVLIQARVWLDDPSTLRQLIQVFSNLWILFFVLLVLFSLLDAFQSLVYERGGQRHAPLRGLVQTIKLLSSIIFGLLTISLLMGKSPLLLLSSLGALSAVLLLVFKDPILGLAAGVQLSANKMLSIGDWLEMPKYDADGDVMDIGLTTVKVRNWDKTITTIPTYALISDSFKNWRGMSESGGRRIKRSIFLEISSIRFLDENLLNHLMRAELLGAYLKDKLDTIEQTNTQKQLDMSITINGRRLTNVGTFRGYLSSYLKAHPGIHQGMTLLVRQLDSTSQGLPIQIYAFTNTTKWSEFEDIQSDIFDHIFAVLPEFGLRPHEMPTGHDVRLLTGINKHT